MQATSFNTSTRHTVFLSHKVKDANVTNCIKRILARHTENVDFFVSEGIEKGANWRKSIADHLNSSSSLVLVFTDPDDDWEWCLYETGFFDALSQIPSNTQPRRIYCLHHDSHDPPDPIADLQSVPANKESVSQWLTEFFCNMNQTKQEFLEDIPQLAIQICGFFANERQPIYSPKSFNIEVECSFLKSTDDLPENTIIRGDNGLMNELFGTNTGIIKWKSVRERFSKFANSSETNLNALKEISRAVYDIYNNNRVIPVQGMIFVGNGPRRYHPVISHARQLPEDHIACEILVVEEVGGQLQNVNTHLGALLTSIRMAVRIRWEIVRPFVLRSNIRMLAHSPRKLRSDLQTCFNNIFLEAEFRGNFSPHDVWGAFESTEDRYKIETMVVEWENVYSKIWQGIGFKDVTETFSEVSGEPFSKQDMDLLDAGMRELEKMNREFLDVAVARAGVLVQRELDQRSA